MKPLLLLLLVILTGCADQLRHPNGTKLAYFPSDATRPRYTYKDAACAITYEADRRSVSTVARAHWLGATKALGTVAPLLSPESIAPAVPIVDSLLRNP